MHGFHESEKQAVQIQHVQLSCAQFYAEPAAGAI